VVPPWLFAVVVDVKSKVQLKAISLSSTFDILQLVIANVEAGR
jgi:hypothetical protein